MSMTTLLRDLRYSFRTLRKSPLFTSVAVLSLALGIGANVAIFTLVNQLILQLLPVSHPEQLVLLSARRPPLRQQHRQPLALLPDVPGFPRQEPSLQWS